MSPFPWESGARSLDQGPSGAIRPMTVSLLSGGAAGDRRGLAVTLRPFGSSDSGVTRSVKKSISHAVSGSEPPRPSIGCSAPESGSRGEPSATGIDHSANSRCRWRNSRASQRLVRLVVRAYALTFPPFRQFATASSTGSPRAFFRGRSSLSLHRCIIAPTPTRLHCIALQCNDMQRHAMKCNEMQ